MAPNRSPQPPEQPVPFTIYSPASHPSSLQRHHWQQPSSPLVRQNQSGQPTHSTKLLIRQQPLICKVTVPKDSGGLYERKTINPPPVVQLVVEDNDPSHLWLTERYFFAVCSLYESHSDSFVQTASENPIVGSNVSFLQKVQENHRDTGLFVFGDISVKLEGQFRLRFDLFEYIVYGNFTLSNGVFFPSYSGLSVVYLKSIISDIFTVYSSKQYPGSLASTDLSRLISDQGIRLRLRKEPNRAKRKIPDPSAIHAFQTNPRINMDLQQMPMYPEQDTHRPTYQFPPLQQHPYPVRPHIIPPTLPSQSIPFPQNPPQFQEKLGSPFKQTDQTIKPNPQTTHIPTTLSAPSPFLRPRQPTRHRRPHSISVSPSKESLARLAYPPPPSFQSPHYPLSTDTTPTPSPAFSAASGHKRRKSLQVGARFGGSLAGTPSSGPASPARPHSMYSVSGVGVQSVSGVGVQSVSGVGVQSVSGVGVQSVSGVGVHRVSGVGLQSVSGVGVQGVGDASRYGQIPAATPLFTRESGVRLPPLQIPSQEEAEEVTILPSIEHFGVKAAEELYGSTRRGWSEKESPSSRFILGASESKEPKEPKEPTEPMEPMEPMDPNTQQHQERTE